MPIPFGKAFSYGTFLQYLRSPGLNAIPCRPTVSRGYWLRGLFLLTYCTIEPISARISAILHRLLHGGVAALFLSSDSSYLCNCRKTSYAMTHCLTTHTKNDAEYFQGNQHGSPRAFTDDNFSLGKSGWIKKTGSKRWQKKDRTTHLQRPETLRHARTADLGVPMMKNEQTFLCLFLCPVFSAFRHLLQSCSRTFVREDDLIAIDEAGGEEIDQCLNP